MIRAIGTRFLVQTIVRLLRHGEYRPLILYFIANEKMTYDNREKKKY